MIKSKGLELETAQVWSSGHGHSIVDYKVMKEAQITFAPHHLHAWSI